MKRTDVASPDDTGRIGIALVGLGRMGRKHLAALRAHPRCSLRAVVDPRAELDADELGNARLLRRIKELAPGSGPGADIQAAVVATPTASHAALARQLLDMGLDLLIEKPIAARVSQARELMEHAKRCRRRLVVAHSERFNPAVVALRQLLAEGALGRTMHVRTLRAGPGPVSHHPDEHVLLDLAIHDIDLLRWCFGPLRLHAGVGHPSLDREARGSLDTAELILLARSGSSASVCASWLDPGHGYKARTWHLVGTHAVCTVDLLRHTCAISGRGDTDFSPIAVPHQAPLTAQLDAWVHYLSSADPGPLCLATDATQALQLAEDGAELVTQPRIFWTGS